VRRKQCRNGAETHATEVINRGIRGKTSGRVRGSAYFAYSAVHLFSETPSQLANKLDHCREQTAAEREAGERGVGRGRRGYQFKPNFREAALLDDAEMLAPVTALNAQITRLAPVLNSPPLENAASVTSSEAQTLVAFTVRRHQGKLYVFAVGMRGSATSATFTLKGFDGRETVEAIDEGRSVTALDGRFQDHFDPWQVHLYRIVTPDGQPL